MSHRIGECSSCGAVYKLPGTFAHDQARCKKCGGVVHIGPAEFPEAAHPEEAKAKPQAPRPAAPPVPARKAPPRPAARPAAAAPAPKPEPAPQPAPAAKKKERSGPSMKEKILARQREAAQGDTPATRSGARVGAPPTAGGATRPARAGAAPGKTRPAPKARAVAAPTSAPTRPGRSARSQPAAAGAGSRRSAPARSRRGGRGADVEDDDEDGGSRRGGRRHAAPKKRNASLLPGLVAIVLMLGLGGAAWFFVTSEETAAGDGSGEEVAQQGDPSAPADGSGDAASGDPLLMDEETGDEAMGQDEPATEGGDEAAATEDEPAAAPPKAPKDPDSVDLSTIEDFGAADGTSEERWFELRQMATDVADPMAGAAGNRAKLKLETAGKEAIPALINVLKRQDLTTDDGFRSADVLTKTLQFCCNQKNFGWKYHQDEDWHYFDKRVIESWASFWKKAKDDEAYWLKITGLGKEEAPAEEGEKEPLITDDEFGDFEDF